MLDVKEFIELPYYRQLFIAVSLWLANQGVELKKNGKLIPLFFICRKKLASFDPQTVKNIAMMLDEATDPIPLRDLQQASVDFVRRKQIEDAEVKSANCPREYRIDLGAFLRS